MQIAKSKLIYKDKEGAEMHGWLFVPESNFLILTYLSTLFQGKREAPWNPGSSCVPRGDWLWNWKGWTNCQGLQWTRFDRERRKIDSIQLGYVTLAADVYGEGKVGATKEESFAILAKMRELRYFWEPIREYLRSFQNNDLEMEIRSCCGEHQEAGQSRSE